MAGDDDDLGTLMDCADVALELAGEFPSYEVTVVGSASGLQFAATRRHHGSPGPYFYMGSAAGVRRALGGKPGNGTA